MNDKDKIDAALQDLEQLRAASTRGEWYVSDTGNELRSRSNNGFALVRWANPPHDAELIVTLHRTIDAQRRILTVAYNDITRETFRYGGTPASHKAAINLAAAILGDTQ